MDNNSHKNQTKNGTKSLKRDTKNIHQNEPQVTERTKKTTKKPQKPRNQGKPTQIKLALSPIQKYKMSKSRHEELQEGGLLSHILFFFLDKVVDKGSKRPYDFDMLYKPHKLFTYEYNHERFNKILEDGINREKPRRFYDMILEHIMFPDYWISDACLGICYIIQTPVPYFAKKLIEWIQEPEIVDHNGWLYGAAICSLVSLRLIIFHQGLYMKSRSEAQLSVALRTVILKKILLMSPGARKHLDFGKISTILIAETRKFGLCFTSRFHYWTDPICIVLYTITLYQEFNWVGLLAPILILILIPIQSWGRGFLYNLEMARIKAVSERSKKTQEIINGIKMIKFNAWENIMIDQTSRMRIEERSILFRFFALNNITEYVGNLIPLLCCLVCIVTYNRFIEPMSLAKTYALIAILASVVHPIKLLFRFFNFRTSTLVSSDRIDAILKLKEWTGQKDDPGIKKGSLCVSNATFSWLDPYYEVIFESSQKDKKNEKKDEKIPGKNFEEKLERMSKKVRTQAVLKEIDFAILPGEFVAVVGKVGGGKTSLLLALLQELHVLEGNVSKNGSIAYVPQEAFLLNDTVRENIIFGNPFKRHRYNRVVDLCELEQDLKSLPGDDLTQIGERGINISGGQKQRIAIARALYSMSDIYLIDDALSALDAEVGGKIMKNVFESELQGKTRIVVTHKLDLLPQFDHIIMVEEGRVIAEGDYEEIRNLDIFKQFSEYIHEQENKSVDLGESSYDKNGLKSVVAELKVEDADYNSSVDMIPFQNRRIRIENQYEISARRFNTRNFRGDVPVSLDSEEYKNLVFDPNYITHRADVTNYNIPFLESVERSPIGSNHQPAPDTERQHLNADNENEETARRQLTGRGDTNLEANGGRNQLTDRTDNEVERRKRGQLKLQETKQEGHIKFSVYSYYLQKAGWFKTSMIVVTYGLFISSRMASDWWSGQWAIKSFGLTDNQYLAVYIILIILGLVLIVLRAFAFGSFVSTTSYKIFRGVMKNILRRPMSYFDTTTAGTIINRCTKDVNDCDVIIPNYMNVTLDYSSIMIASVVLVVLVSPAIALVILLFIWVFGGALKKYMMTSVELSRMNKLSASPLIQRLSELKDGFVSLRVFGKQDYMEKNLIEAVELMANVYHLDQVSTYWLRVRLDYPLILLLWSSFGSLILNKYYRLLTLTDPSLIGSIITFLTVICNLTALYVDQLVGLLKEMSGVERIYEYSQWKIHEKPWEKPKAPKEWATRGKIFIKNLKIRYRENLPLVLKGVTFEVKPSEKIGIVGRTGSGKSTLLLALTRIIEAESLPQDPRNRTKAGVGEASYIKIDDVNIHEIGLHELRRNVVIIPQDPFLFQGTVRFNLDPFGAYPEKHLIQSLKKIDIGDLFYSEKGATQKHRGELKDGGDGHRMAESTSGEKRFESLGKDGRREGRDAQNLINRSRTKFDYARFLKKKIEANGSNLSVGQRQLICIARAIVKSPKILLIDEATANIDLKTDAKIQKILAEEMVDTTVLTIAHRLDTVMNYDRIVVMEKGRKIEMGTPHDLLNEEMSFFRFLVAENGEDFMAKMMKIAKKSKNRKK